MYRVTPVFEGENLVASGVWMEAESVEDNGQGVSFNVYVYNVQPGIEIDYARETAGRQQMAASRGAAAKVASQKMRGRKMPISLTRIPADFTSRTAPAWKTSKKKIRENLEETDRSCWMTGISHAADVIHKK